MAHNLARTEQIVTTKTLRSSSPWPDGPTLHRPQRWPWETQFSRALARLRLA